MGAFSTDQFKPSGNFDGKIAYACGLASDVAYYDKKTIKEFLIDEGMLPKPDSNSTGLWSFDFFEFKKTDTQAFVVADREKVIVAFRGSEPGNWIDWMETNASFHPVPDFGAGIGQVHHGFQNALMSVWGLDGGISVYLDQIHPKGDTRKIYFTGHSLGGALATLAAHRYRNRNGSTPWTYTYGAPKVGDEEFCKGYDKSLKRTTIRYINDLDLVPHVPGIIAGDYTTVGHPVYFASNGDVSSKPWPEYKRKIEKFLPIMKGSREADLLIQKFADHSMTEYLPLLKRHINTPIEFLE